jgi:TrbL/VirB6 plasmid conjugal transfer protein
VLRSPLNFETWLTTQYDQIVRAMEHVLRAEMDAVLPTLRWVAAIFVGITFLRWGLGYIDWRGAGMAGLRMAVVVMLIGGQGIYMSRVRVGVMETIPNETARVITGTGGRMPAAAQFDTVSMAAENLAAEIRLRNTGWSIAALVNGLAALAANALFQFWLTVLAAVWLASIRLTAIALCLGVWLLLLEVFETTRGWVRHWVGILAGLLLFQIASSVFLQISMRSTMGLLRTTMENSRASGTSVEQMVLDLLHVSLAMFADAMTMLALPTICAVAGGGGAYLAAGMAARFVPGQMARAHDKVRAWRRGR